MTAHLLTIGDEILIGQIVDTNSAWMSRELNLRGIRVTGKSSVADTRDAILSGIQYAAVDADVIIMTGGLGPTKDDVTKKTLADLFESEMRFDAETLERIEGYFKKVNRPMAESIRTQALVPEKATVLANKVGTAPGMWFEKDGKVFISLPGVPFEMEYLMSAEVMPRLLHRFKARPIVHRTILTACEGESRIAERIDAFEASLPEHIKLAYLPALGQVRLRLTGVWPGEVTLESEAELAAQLDAKKAALVALIPDLIYGYETENLSSALGKLLLEKGLTFGTAESCTGGYIAHLITEIPGASRYYPGSVVTYSYEMKEKLLGVQHATLLEFGAVSEECVREMAIGARSTLGVDIAVAVSGIAGPDGGMPGKPVGTVWMAVATKDKVVAQKHIFGRDRLKNIELTATYALNMAMKLIKEL